MGVVPGGVLFTLGKFYLGKLTKYLSGKAFTRGKCLPGGVNKFTRRECRGVKEVYLGKCLPGVLHLGAFYLEKFTWERIYLRGVEGAGLPGGCYLGSVVYPGGVLLGSPPGGGEPGGELT